MSWYIAGPLIGLFVPVLLLLGRRRFGVSASLRHVCAATIPGRADYFRYDWKREGLWNITFVAGLLVGGFVSVQFLGQPERMGISPEAEATLRAIGVTRFEGIVPTEIFSWSKLATLPGLVSMVIGGFLVGFGARWAGGCTSGHSITGLAEMQPASLLATACFFAGGVAVTWLITPYLL
ncbi:MAG TPA: YeeE/YedE thiosulfate transporter family protein [Rhodothermales bacterium]